MDDRDDRKASQVCPLLAAHQRVNVDQSGTAAIRQRHREWVHWVLLSSSPNALSDHMHTSAEVVCVRQPFLRGSGKSMPGFLNYFG